MSIQAIGVALFADKVLAGFAGDLYRMANRSNAITHSTMHDIPYIHGLLNPHPGTRMQLNEIGQAVAKRRAELDLTEAQLARLAGLSRLTVNQLETGKLKDLGINKLIPLLALLGIELVTHARRAQRGLYKATVSANVSYTSELTERRLVDALATGEIPAGYESQFAVILDEVPLPVVVQAVEEAAEHSGTPPRSIWKNLAAWSRALHLYRKVWV